MVLGKIMKHIRIKICGITRVEDALAAANAGVDAIGLVFYDKSPRCVNIGEAKKIVSILPAFVSVVALFVNETAEKINHILSEVPIDIIQFHGDETTEFCSQFNRPYIKAIRVKTDNCIPNAIYEYKNARALLFDTFHQNQYGGVGESFDWSLIPPNIEKSWILAGGLNLDNIKNAIISTKATCVDISSGVESQKGIKSPEKIITIVKAIRLIENGVD